MHFECDLLRELHSLRFDLAQGELGFALFRTTRAAIEQCPVQQQGDRGVIAAASEFVFLTLSATIEAAPRERWPRAIPPL